jgi:hypothetical protein
MRVIERGLNNARLRNEIYCLVAGQVRCVA